MKPNPYPSTIFVGGIIGLFLGSCTPIEVSDEEQSASLASYGEHSMQNEKLEHFFGARTAVLFSADQLQLTKSETSSTELDSGAISASMNIKFSKAETDLQDWGTAAAIDPRGYFLTAAHCIDEGDTYALFAGKKYQFEAKKIRIVKMGKATADEFDFAIFHVDSAPLRTYRWSENFSDGDTVFSAGASLRIDEKEKVRQQLTLDPFAGKIEGSRALEFQGVPFQKVAHRSPIRPGNSGGPLVAEDGRIIGINYAGRFRHKWSSKKESPLGFAVRPDWNWIEDIIQKDWAKLKSKKST